MKIFIAFNLHYFLYVIIQIESILLTIYFNNQIFSGMIYRGLFIISVDISQYFYLFLYTINFT